MADNGRLEGKSVFRTPDNPFGEFHDLFDSDVPLTSSLGRGTYIAFCEISESLIQVSVGVVGSGKGITEYERMGKHKFQPGGSDE